MQSFDLIIIGSGPAGKTAAIGCDDITDQLCTLHLKSAHTFFGATNQGPVTHRFDSC